VNAGLIKTVFFNLLSNAAKYVKQGISPVIEISCDTKEIYGMSAPVKYCRIFIKDNGIGFEQEYAEQIFEMFKRLHTRQAYPGTGIGLALCKRIVEKHHGYISALSKPDEGSTFIVSLPFQQQGRIEAGGL
jgi:signal transduction histidine kinase